MATLAVDISEVRAGLLHQSNEGSYFELDERYLATAGRPVLGQVFEDDPMRTYWTRQGVPRWFANLLPEGPLRHLVAERAGVDKRRSWFLLTLLGGDLPGAVHVRPVEGGPADDESEVPATDAAEMPLRFSLAGVQLKFSAMREDRALTIPATGRGGDWIVKLPDGRFPGVPENEYLMMHLAARCGLDVPDTDLIDVAAIEGLPVEASAAGDKALAVRRFDRADDGRVHIEDFAQVRDLAPRDKYGATNYDTIARTISALCPGGDVDELVRRLVFMVAIGNSDAHAKNWSLIYPDGRSARLAPAYDLVAVSVYERIEPRLRPQLALRLAGVRDFAAVNEETFRRFAQRSGLDDQRVVSLVSDQVERVHAAWSEMKKAREHPLDPALRDVLDSRLASLPLMRSS